MRFQTFLLAVLSSALGINAYWLETISHQGVAPFAGTGYKFFRNVKDYGARGDGVTDDTSAINAAINDPGNRCLQGCASTTTTPAILYFPAGTYMISSSIVPSYFTQLVGDPSSRPILKATSNFAGFGLIDGNPYYTSDPNWVTTNVFYRQVRNFVIDTTNIAPGTAATGMHWPTSQATSLQNIEFNMPTASGVVHVGLFIESGSGGFMSDLTFNGGATGASMGNQQYTMRNFTFNNCVTAIIHLWDWGWTYMGLSINNCSTGIDITAGGSSALTTGAVVVIDSSFVNVPVGILTAYTSSSLPDTAGNLVLENVALQNVPVAVKGPSGTVLSGATGSTTITGWSEGNRWTSSGPSRVQGTLQANSRPSALLEGNKYYTRSKPQYETLSADQFVSVRSAGAKGDAAADDTAAIQSAINNAASAGKVVFIDFGLYRLTSTVVIPAGTKIVGEGYPVLMAAGTGFFTDASNPVPLLQVGATSGTVGTVEFSDFVVATQGSQPGAILIEWNLASSGAPSAMWDVHTRVGGFTGSNLQVAQCLKNAGSSEVVSSCVAAYMSMHITTKASNLYMENCWLWTADHDIDDATNTQTTIYAGRGLLDESTAGPLWLIGTASEHHVLYNYQFVNTKNIFAAQLQTETPYYQPTPNALVPFTVNSALHDPDFSTSCSGVSGNCAASWGLRIVDSSDIVVYGAGHYSFFSSYDTTCSTVDAGENCQSRMVSLEGTLSNINFYDLRTIGSLSIVNRDGTSLASWEDYVNVYPASINVLRI
ncbi:pectate lyase superfamily protein-domain-containing protein [Pseudomassariella vexata]|uniref:Pectate lyase superfamily protein-domain-containing protein n=1 Tax=Pseudomassariella vexata TaxID=1141098 RepID=A0A1Y2DTU3_9PEZI|nr:pectate lyase superfamily protein-domain-containing protein [Pseudomassariella vexata]ORY62667.1 pectate lyase superfamily protein-domain-containing protein [Pseudomassariella vexata]